MEGDEIARKYERVGNADDMRHVLYRPTRESLTYHEKLCSLIQAATLVPVRHLDPLEDSSTGVDYGHLMVLRRIKKNGIDKFGRSRCAAKI